MPQTPLARRDINASLGSPYPTIPHTPETRGKENLAFAFSRLGSTPNSLLTPLRGKHLNGGKSPQSEQKKVKKHRQRLHRL